MTPGPFGAEAATRSALSPGICPVDLADMHWDRALAAAYIRHVLHSGWFLTLESFAPSGTDDLARTRPLNL